MSRRKRPLKTITVRGKRMWLVNRPRKGTLGHCEPPGSGRPTMFIPVEGDAKHDLDTIVHEILHAGAWDLSEEAVGQIAGDIAKVLWRLDWRKELD